MRNLAEGKIIIIKPADKESCVVVWNFHNCLAGAEKRLSYIETYGEVTFSAVKMIFGIS